MDRKISQKITGVAVEHTLVRLVADSAQVEGTLSMPSGVRGVVLFAHGSGSTHRSPRNRFVADILNESGLGTLLIDLLTPDEQQVDLQTAQLRFDIPFLGGRLTGMTGWLGQHPEVRHLPIGLFGASTGAAAALLTAAERPDVVRAVVSRGGRPDLAASALETVQSPTLLIVGGDDSQVIELNRLAMARMRCPRDLKIIPGATHLFKEPGALDDVAKLAAEWFGRYLASSASDTG